MGVTRWLAVVLEIPSAGRATAPGTARRPAPVRRPSSCRLRRPGSRLLVMKGPLVANELDACALPAAALTTVSLEVPGYAERHLVIVKADAAASEAGAFVP